MKTFKTYIPIVVLTAALTFGTGCASIITGGTKRVSLHSQPSGAAVTVVDEKGTMVYEGTTPAEARLKTGKPYFSSKEYEASFRLDGYETATATLKSQFNGWYLGNLIFGGLVGLLVVDPLTGAVYTLPEEVQVTLIRSNTPYSTEIEQDVPTVVSLSEVPAHLRSQLIPVSDTYPIGTSH